MSVINQGSEVSDHDMVIIDLPGYEPDLQAIDASCEAKGKFFFGKIQEETAHNLKRAAYTELSRELDTESYMGMPTSVKHATFERLYETICATSGVPKKVVKTRKRNIPLTRRRLIQKRKLLNKKLIRAKSEVRKDELNSQIVDVNAAIHRHIAEEVTSQEIRVVESIIDDPKLFFNHMASKRIKDYLPGPLKVGGKRLSKPKEMAEALLDQFSKVLTTPVVDPGDILHPGENELNHIQIEPATVHKHLLCIDANSSAGPDGIDPWFLKNCALEIAPFLADLFQTSINEGIFPDPLKRASVTPIRKGGSKAGQETTGR